MAFDIYGERLERGHCEVHPWVGEEYPCSICCNENNKRQQENRFYRQQEEEYYKDMEAEMRHQQYLDFSPEYKVLHEREEKLKRLLNIIQEKKQELAQNIPF